MMAITNVNEWVKKYFRNKEYVFILIFQVFGKVEDWVAVRGSVGAITLNFM